MSYTRPCAHCGQPLRRRANENNARFSRRRFCSHSCASRARRPQEPPPMCHIEGCDQPAKARKRRLCSRHYEAWRRAHRMKHGDVVIDDEPTVRHPPIKCVFCEAVKVCAWRGYDADETAEAMGKPLAWIRAHLENCEKERVA